MKKIMMLVALVLEVWRIIRDSRLGFDGWNVEVVDDAIVYNGAEVPFVGLCVEGEKMVYMSISKIAEDAKLADVSFWKAARLNIRHEFRHAWQFEAIGYELCKLDLQNSLYFQSVLEIDAYNYQLRGVNTPMEALAQTIRNRQAGRKF